jgi:RimJ/RimL family protein N-acetyltransferase
MITFRRASPSDEAELFAVLLKQAAEDEFTTLTFEEATRVLHNVRSQWAKNLESDGTFFYLVAIAENKIIGFSDIHQGRTARTSHVVEFGRYVVPEWRRKQIGRRLQNEALNWAMNQSEIKKVKVVIAAANLASVQSSLGNGFKEEYRMKGEILLKDGSYEDLICLSYKPFA